MRSASMVGIVVATLVVANAPASAEVTAASRKCRKTIASKASSAGVPPGLVKRALAALDKCHAKRDKGKFSGDCNAVELSALQGKFAAAINKACKPDDPVRKNYVDDDPAADVTNGVAAALAASGAAVQGSPALTSDKAKAKCHAAIGKGRSAAAQAVLGGLVRCQAALDKTADQLGGLAADCVATSGSAGSKASGKISGACGGLTGADVGSCDPLPGCVIAAAEATGRTVAEAIYGEGAVCGNGVIERNEECDDGNTADGDSCTHACKSPVCGDKIVSAGEDCDDGNTDNTDACTRVCSGSNTGCVCRAARCGDGFLQAGEQCDDGNDVPNDGCGSCQIEPTACTPGVGVLVTVAVSYDDISREMRGVELNLGYPAVVAIPGHGEDTSVQDRILDAATVAFLLTGNDSDQNSDGTDDRLRVVYGALSRVPKGDVVRVLFDCQSQAFLQAANFSCVVTSTSDPQGEQIPGQNTCSVTLSIPTP